ncbi:MAG: Hsp20/alpha crystallin family protein [Chloroflexota bacterium]|nr:MAG: Hsp20/alpha crystallin family protein [Chloroflexota bacterium]
MSMMRWDPFRELESIREAMDRVFEEPLWSAIRRPAEFEAVHTIPIDMYETDNDIFVRALVPGVKPEDISINVSGNLLSIRAERRAEEQVKRENFMRREIGAGRFYREMTLPMTVNADQSEATFEHGILTLRLPKAEETKPKKIQVKGIGQAGGRQIQGTPQQGTKQQRTT